MRSKKKKAVQASEVDQVREEANKYNLRPEYDVALHF